MIKDGVYIEPGDWLYWQFMNDSKYTGWTVERVLELFEEPYLGYEGIVLSHSETFYGIYQIGESIKRSYKNGVLHKRVSLLSETEVFVYSL